MDNIKRGTAVTHMTHGLGIVATDTVDGKLGVAFHGLGMVEVAPNTLTPTPL